MGFDFLVPCCIRNPRCLNLSLQYSSDSVVYDPTTFIACKLVIVAWLIAYGATTKPRALWNSCHMVMLLGTCWYRGC